MAAFPSASKVIAAPEATISNTSSAELTSAATCGASPPRESTASQKSRADPAEAGRAATGSSAISANETDERPASGCAALRATNRRSTASTSLSIKESSTGSQTNAASPA